ncbi:hypothetical protein E2C01_102729 [Portunus trituberculatus]|uniref:Uncharacterized protein n=1 Tax=Portunus trituberculatus TaxID=210409 RepID=A0A5B7KJ85_PORTR|nr:hypothetical protein [Portunus trituberculatus]
MQGSSGFNSDRKRVWTCLKGSHVVPRPAGAFSISFPSRSSLACRKSSHIRRGDPLHPEGRRCYTPEVGAGGVDVVELQ